MATIDYERLKRYAGQFTDRVILASRHLQSVFPEQNVYRFKDRVDFHNGFFLMEEGYKSIARKKRDKYLHLDSWNDIAVQSGIIEKEVLALVYDKDLDNLVPWQNKDDLKKKLEKLKNQEEYFVLVDCLRGIYLGSDDRVSFQHAQNCMGGIFPLLSYFFFIKDPDNYLPVRPKNFSSRFQKIGITGWNSLCSWDNYMDFISIIGETRAFMRDYFQTDDISLLDAHSFIWMEWMLEEPDEEFLRDAEAHCRIALGKKSRSSFTREHLAEEAEKIEAAISKLNLEGEERETVVRIRINQGVFRNLLVSRYDRCCLCNVKNPAVLFSSHIKPWADSTSEEKLDPDNGFLLCPNHDRLFDKGFITFDDSGRIKISDLLEETDRIFLNVHSDMKISLTEGNRRYLQYHREHIFKTSYKGS